MRWGPAVVVAGITSAGSFLAHFCEALLGPIIPMEADTKRITPTQFGLIIGIVYSGVILFAPVFGHTISEIPPPFTFQAGLFVCTISTVLLGVLQYSPSGETFFATALAVRTVLGIGVAAVQTSSIAIITKTFPEKTARGFAFLRVISFWGGLISPLISTYLYQVGGFGVPFYFGAGLSLLVTILALVFYPKSEYVSHSSKNDKVKLVKFWFNKNTAIHSIIVIKAMTYFTFNHSILEPNLRQFKITPVSVGAIYAFTNFANSFSNPVWGCFLDRVSYKKALHVVTSCFILMYFVFAGPLPYFTWSQELWLFILMQVCLAIGTSGSYVCAYSCTISDAINHGFPDDISTYGLASSVYTTVSAIGGFIGSVLGGYLLGTIGFQHATVIFFYLEIAIMFLTLFYIFYDCTHHFGMDEHTRLVSVKEPSQRVAEASTQQEDHRNQTESLLE